MSASLVLLRPRISAPPLRGLLVLIAALLLCLPFYRALTLPVGPVHLSIADGITLLCGLYIGAAFCLGRPIAWPVRAFSVALALYLFAICGSIIDAYSRSRSIHYLASILLDLVLFVTVYQVMRTPRSLRVFTASYVTAACIVAGFAALQGMAVLGGGGVASVAGTLAARNEMVFVLLPGFAMALASAFQRGPARLGYVAAALLILAAVVLSRGRAGTLFCLALLMWVPLLVLRSRGLRVVEVLVLWGALALAGGLFFTSSGVGERLLSRYTTSLQAEFADQRGSAWTRFEVLRGALAAYRSSPVLGIGADNFKLTSGHYVEGGDGGGLHDLSEIQPHSTYLGALAETGLLGLAGFAGLVLAGLLSLRGLRYCRPADRPVLVGVLTAFACLAAYLAVFDAGARPNTWMFLAVALATREVAPSPRFRPVVVRIS